MESESMLRRFSDMLGSVPRVRAATCRIVLLASLLPSGCGTPPSLPPSAMPEGVVMVSPSASAYNAQADSGLEDAGTPHDVSLKGRAHDVLLALKRKDMSLLADLVHPIKGVRFSTYGMVSPASDVVLAREQVRGALGDTTVRTWGTYDGSGEPIRLTFSGYFDAFVYFGDFAAADQIAIGHVQRGCNANMSEDPEKSIRNAYHRAEFVDCFLPDDDARIRHEVWGSLRLVFEEDGTQRWLVGVIHDRWTI